MFGKESEYETIQVLQGEVILREGKTVNELIIVKSGDVACVTLSNDRVVPVYTISGAGVVGEDGILSEGRASAYSAIALTDANIIKIPKEDIMKFIDASSSWVKNILFDISDKVSKTTEVISEHRIIDDRFNGGKLLTGEEEVMIKKSLSSPSKS